MLHLCMSVCLLCVCGLEQESWSYVVHDRPMFTMEHYWEVDPRGAECVMTFDVGWPLTFALPRGGGCPQFQCGGPDVDYLLCAHDQ